MLEENKNLKAEKAVKPKEGAAAPKKKKLAVVFHSQNSVNHKDHPLGAKTARKAAPRGAEKKNSPNGRPLPPGTARVTPLRELNAIQQKREEQARRAEQERLTAEQEKNAAEMTKRDSVPEPKRENAAETVKREQPAVRVLKAPEKPAAERPKQDIMKELNAPRPVIRNVYAEMKAQEQREKAAQERRERPLSRGDRENRGARPQGDRPFRGGRPGSTQGGERRPFARDPQRAAGGRSMPGRRDGGVSGGLELSEKSGGHQRHEAVKPQRKTYGNKAAENEKAALSQRNRNSRKQNKYGAAQSYERDDMQHKSRRTGKGAFIRPEVVKKEEEQIKAITIPELITIQELADKMKQKAADIIKKLFLQGKLVTLNTELSYEEAENIAVEYDILCEKEEEVDVIAELVQDSLEDSEEELRPRPPVVCVMGHVDHGKTSILDAIRNTNVTSREHGGITQSIGAYQVSVEVNGENRSITFLDTPGHEAFTAMRMRGAQSTDIAVLVVAADDGIMPQTVEAINHAKAANTQIIVAINKIDKPTANIEKVKQELMKYDLVSEDYGGDVICCPVSAKTGEGIEELLENIVLEADVMELRANPDRIAYGVVIEAELDKGRGSVARLLVQKGTLSVGDVVAVGSAYGKVRAMVDDKGKRIKKATPSMPVEILGLNAVPNAGEIFQVKDNEKEAKAYAATFVSENKQRMVEESKKKVSLDALFDQIKAGEIKELPIIVKADVQGSVEAVKDSLEKIRNEEVMVRVIHSGVGAINESDINLAIASNAIVIGFDVKPDTTAKDIADREHVDVRLYNIIYKAIEDIENAMKGMLAPVYEEKVIGHAVVRMIFKSSDVGTIAGSYVLDGMVQRGAKARIRRGEELLFDGAIASVKRFKDDVKEVRTGYECGLVFEGFSDLQEEDQIEAYVMEEVKR